MKVPEVFQPVSNSFTEDNHKEFLCWIAPNDPIQYFPEFFRTELLQQQDGVKHFISDKR